MIEWYFSAATYAALAAGLVAIVLGLFRRKPSGFSISLSAIVLIALLIQLIISIVLVVRGQQAKTDTVEFFAYLIVALMVPIGAAFWALLDRTRWSTVVLGVGSLTVTVMLVRMWQIWTGTSI